MGGLSRGVGLEQGLGFRAGQHDRAAREDVVLGWASCPRLKEGLTCGAGLSARGDKGMIRVRARG
jgi:hypothetical protein